MWTKWLLVSAWVTTALWADSRPAEVRKLAPLLQVTAGSVVAEIGGGDGVMAEVAASIVGPKGHVYVTEIDEEKLAKLKKKFAGSAVVTAVESSPESARLPAACCDAIYMRRVFHHFTKPVEFNGSLFAALKPGGRIGVIDAPSKTMLKIAAPLKDMPEDRKGHGIESADVEKELKAAGFGETRVMGDWPESHYCVLGRK